MEPAANDYLYTLAVVAVTFVGFSTIFATFRQALGGDVSKYDLLLTRSILHLGAIVVLGALLPPMLALLLVKANLIQRGASAVAGILALVLNATYPARRRAATGRPMPKKVWIEATLITSPLPCSLQMRSAHPSDQASRRTPSVLRSFASNIPRVPVGSQPATT